MLATIYVWSLVTDVMAGTVDNLVKRSHGRRLPISLLKHVIRDVLRGLVRMNKVGLIRGGLSRLELSLSALEMIFLRRSQASNILCRNPEITSNANLDHILKTDVSRRNRIKQSRTFVDYFYKNESSSSHKLRPTVSQTAVSQPVIPTLDQAAGFPSSFVLYDFDKGE